MSPSASPEPARPAPATEAADLSRVLVDLGLRAGLCAVGVTTAGVFEGTRSDLVERKRHGLDGGMQFTYRNPDRSTDPGRILPGARSLVVGAWSYRHEEPPAGAVRVPPGRPAGQVARYARRDHYASLREALGVVACALRERGWRRPVVCDDNALVDRAAAHRAGLGWFGKNSLLLLPGLGSWFVLGRWSPTPRSGPTAPGGAVRPCRRGAGAAPAA